MISGKKENWVERRRHKKADAERAIIDGCVYHIASKYEECSRNVAAYQKRVDTASAQVIKLDESGANSNTVYALISQVEMLESQLDLENNLLNMFGELKGMLGQLLVYVDALIRMGDYKYVIATIPEKKIPKYVKASKAEEITKIIDITRDLLSTIQDRFTIVSQSSAAFKGEIDRVNSVARSMREGVQKSPEERKAAIEEFKARKLGTSKFVDPVPANTQKNENTGSRPTNLA